MNKNIRAAKNILKENTRTTRLVAIFSVYALFFGALLTSSALGSPTSDKGRFVGPGQAIATAAEKVSEVRSIELIKAEGGVIVRTNIYGKLLFTHQIIPSKDGKPYRIILDCLNADHKLGKTKFMNLPKSIVASIRSSQFSVKPERISRLVLDLEREALYRVTQGPSYVDIFVTDKTAGAFSNWSSLGAKNVSPVKKIKPKSKTVSGDKKSVKLATAEPKKSKSAYKKADTKNASANTPRSSQPATKLAVVEKKTVKSSKSISEKASGKISGKTSERTIASKPVVSVKTKKASAKTASKPAAATKKSAQHSPNAQFSNLASSRKSAVKKSSVKKSAVKKSAVKKSVKKKTSAVSLASKPAARKTKANKANKKTSADKNSRATTLAITNRSDGAKANKVSVSDNSKSVPTTLKISTRGKSETPKAVKTQKKTAFSNVANAASGPSKSVGSGIEKANTAKFRRVAERVAKLKGTQIAEFPKRLVIKYNSYKTDDPFATLIDKNKVNNNPSRSLIPNVENLLMVGVLQNKNNKNRGLFEDQDGRGYILKPGDKVENGRVLKVTSKKAYFQIFEYGWSRTVSLQLHE